METVLFSLSLVAYTAGIVLAIVGNVRRSRPARSASTAFYALACALQLGGIVAYSVHRHTFLLSNRFEYLLTLGWLVLALHLVVQARFRIQLLGLVLPPLAFVMTVIALRMPSHAAPQTLLQQKDFLLFHTALATLGMAAFFVAAAMSLIYVLQDVALKRKWTMKWLDRLPSLEKTDRAGLEALLWGFPLFTLGILSGAGLAATEHHRFWIGGAKGIFPVIAWVIFAVVLGARLARGFRGRKAAYLTMAGFLFGMLTIVGINL